jgi:hypothetical protein
MESSSSSKFEALFQAALAKYSKQTGQSLVNHPLTAVLDRCDSPDAILTIFGEQARAFDEFRKGDPKLIKWLRPLVKSLHTICTTETLCTAADLISPVSVSLCVFVCVLEYVSFLQGVLARKGNILGHWDPSFRAYLPRISKPALFDIRFY